MSDATANRALAAQRGADLRGTARRPTSLTVAAARLANSWVFANLSQRELRTVVKRSTTRAVPAGAVVIEEGGPGDEFFVVVAGQVRVSRNGRTVTTLGPGASFGELALLDRGPRTATVTAAADTTLLVLRRRDFERLLADSSGFCRKLLAGVARRLTEADTKRVESS